MGIVGGRDEVETALNSATVGAVFHSARSEVLGAVCVPVCPRISIRTQKPVVLCCMLLDSVPRVVGIVSTQHEEQCLNLPRKFSDHDNKTLKKHDNGLTWSMNFINASRTL